MNEAEWTCTSINILRLLSSFLPSITLKLCEASHRIRRGPLSPFCWLRPLCRTGTVFGELPRDRPDKDLLLWEKARLLPERNIFVRKRPVAVKGPVTGQYWMSLLGSCHAIE
jgi:hypothetical protein